MGQPKSVGVGRDKFLKKALKICSIAASSYVTFRNWELILLRLSNTYSLEKLMKRELPC
jgi:hypothetical protein